jgi:2-methylisocitrate lyase-like PEP mutase family enzyme
VLAVQIHNAEVFASLHQAGEPLLLANAWDVASAIAIEAAGAKAIATTSAGMAWSLGIADAAGFSARRAAEVIARIAAAVSVPVSADIEAGYGDSPDAVAATVRAVVQAGAVGVNLEDRRDGASLFLVAEQADRLAAARAAAGDIPVWINARTDVFLSGACPPAPAELFTSGTYDSSADGFDYGTTNDASAPRSRSPISLALANACRCRANSGSGRRCVPG